MPPGTEIELQPCETARLEDDGAADNASLRELLAQSRARIEQYERARCEFISNVSHEMRTPLTSMKYALGNLLRGTLGPLPDPVRKYLQMLAQDCERLTRTVNQILDLRGIETRKIRFIRVSLPFSRLVHRSVASVRNEAEAKGLKLAVSVAQAAGFVSCDPVKMEVVFSNVLRNAIRFTPPGGEIDVRGQRSTQNPEHLTLDVTDTGIGIPPDYVVRVTEKYFRVGDFVDGTGLGLSIAKEVVEGHGGRIDIRSPPPGCAAGTRVTITLPAAVPPLILVVDDAPDVRDLLECHLCLYGFRVVKCASGEEALQSMGLERPDMMILDLFMPGMGGEGVILQMKADPSLRTVPMVVMTGALDKPSREMLDAFGVPAFLKPLREKELLDCVEEAMVGSATLRSPSDRKRTKERT